ncbi:EamA family transporter [Paenibacillus sp. ACRRX]|uniref:EamA family transporter n=1 Tax=Paenibacillus sp. ACRRX TaxID=2918206 RepID=UPI001EF3FEE9|nr:EamA family transporter [Paenibacillus sp. ACRRX]MCG7406916.1 EamA family transporter [Paenibacillus sp. ACRRX]
MNYLYSLMLLFGGLFAINFVFSYQGKHIDAHFWSTLKFQLWMIPVFLIANLSVGYGVKFGLKSTGNLSYVLVVAKCMEIVISIIMGYLFLKEIPNWKTWIGLAIIVAGIVLVKQK